LGDFAGLTENSLLYFGMAAHTLADLGSPYHVADDGTPFTWYGTFGRGGLRHIFGEDLFGVYGDRGWLRIGASIRNIVAGFFTAFPEEATTLLGDPDKAAQRAINKYVNNALMPFAVGGSLTPVQVRSATQRHVVSVHNPSTSMTVKRIVRSWAVGAGIMVVVMYAANAGTLPDSLQVVFLPGLYVSSILRFGSHDIGTVFTTFVVDSILFGVLVLLVDFLEDSGQVRSPFSFTGMSTKKNRL
jgi:hypothetical protein